MNRTFLAATAVFSLTLAACGGGGGAEEVSLRDFVRAGDDVCETTEDDRADIVADLEGASDEDELIEVITEDYQPYLQDQIDELRKLDLPSDEKDQEDVEELLDELQDISDEMADDPEGIISGDNPFEDARERADDLGFRVCGQAGEDEPTDDTVTDDTVEDTVTDDTTAETDPGQFGDNQQASVIAGLLSQQFTAADPSFEATSDDEQCIADQLSAIYTEESLALLADGSIAFEDLTPEDQANVLSAVESCVPSEVIAGYVSEGIMESVPTMSAEQSMCVSQSIIDQIGVQGLLELGQLGDAETPPEVITGLLAVMQACMSNAELGEVFAPYVQESLPGLDATQAACITGGLFDVFGVEGIVAFNDPAFAPTPEQEQALVDVITGCGIDPSQL